MGKHTKKQSELAPEALEHLRHLQLGSVEEYWLWCESHGLTARLRKSARECQHERQLRTQELQAAALTTARRLQRNPEATFAAALAEKPPSTLLRRPELAALVRLCEERKPSSATRSAFLALLLLASERGTLLRTEPVIERYGQDRARANTFIGGLLALAEHHAEWIRPREAWRPSSHNPRRQFASLVRHLLVRYTLPACFDSVWFQPNVAIAREQRRWACFVALGHNPRQAGFPVALTKRMAHLLLTEAPEHLTLEEALRWSQAVGMGASEPLAQAICATPLGQALEDESFWETVVRFLVQHPLLDLAQVGPLIDYLRYERNEPRRRDDPLRLPEGFTMAGRSPAALLQRMEQWHGQLARQQRAAQASWEPTTWPGLTVEEPITNTDNATRWTITELTTAKELLAEGAAMHHCVGSYVASCARGAVSVWGLRRQLPWESVPQRVMTIAVTPQRVVTEARGKWNSLPGASGSRNLTSEERALLPRAWHYFQQWALREGLTIPAHLRH